MILSIAWVIFWAAAVPFKKGIYLIVTFSALLIGAAGGVLYLGNKGWLPQMFNHAYERIATLRDSFIDSHGAGYQMTHSFYALYNGGIFGRGLGNSITKKRVSSRDRNRFYFFDYYRRAWANRCIVCAFLIVLIMHENLLFKQSL